MKIWPIVTLGALLYGGTYSDALNTQRESNPHPARHRSSLDAEVAAFFAQPHRPVTMAFREVFAKLLNEETDWSAPDGKATAQAEADADDGQDPGKKLFWSTNHPDITGVPFPGWGDPNAEPDHPLVSPPACSSCRPELFFYIITEDPAPSHENENAVAEAQSSFTMRNLPFGALKALDNMIIATGADGGLIVAIAPCETIMVNGICPSPCKGADDPLCRDASEVPPTLSEPGGPIVAGDPPPFVGGGGSGSGMGGGIGGGQSVGSVPEPSTWALLALGFAWLALMAHKRRKAVHGAPEAV
jgi:PEP-CTERM motif